MKVTKLSEKEVSRFFEARMNRDAISKTLQKAKSLHMTESECQPIILKRFQLEKEFMEIKQELISKAIINSNLIDFQNGWYGIVIQNKKSVDIMTSPLKEINVDDFICDFNVESSKTRQEYSQLMAGKIDFDILEKYQDNVFRKQDEYLKEFFGCENSIEKDDKTFFLTSHCIKRWKERIKKNDDEMTIELRKNISEEIHQAFVNAELVYQNNTGDYYLDKNTMAFFVVSLDNVIITLWRNTYNFPSDEINNACTLMILEHLKEKQKEFIRHENEKEQNLLELNQHIKEKDEEIEAVQQEINVLLAKKKSLEECKKVYLEGIECVHEVFNKACCEMKEEENLLFKPHKVVCDE